MNEHEKIENITIFLPRKLQEKSSGLFYGKCTTHENIAKFYIVSDQENQNLELIGILEGVSSSENLKNLVRFSPPEPGSGDYLRVKDIVLDSVPVEQQEIKSTYLIAYDGLQHIDPKFRAPNISTEQRYDVIYLAELLDILRTNKQSHLVARELWSSLRKLAYFYFMSVCNVLAWSLAPLRRGLMHSAVFRHFLDWMTCLKSYSFENGRAWTLVFDICGGILALTLLLQLGNPGDYLMQFTQLVVNNLKSLLVSLKGSPVGLKLNVLLNHFFLNCFIYHVELWHTFLKVLAPVVQYLSIPLAVLGLFGISFQLAMLSDLLILISLHAYCFYIYAAVLYRIEVIGIKALWRVVLGRRKNVLRGRVESHEYMARQLFLATMFFAALLFLLPTVLVYYCVFASLRFGIYCITYVLMTIRKKILVLPVFTFCQWVKGSYSCPDCMEMSIVDSYAYKPSLCKSHYVTVLRLESKSSTPWRKSLFDLAEDINQNEPLSIGKFLSKLIKGEMMGFLQPEQKVRE